MSSTYRPLNHLTLSRGARCTRPQQQFPERVRPDAPAMYVMTDLRRTVPFGITPDATVKQTNDKMIMVGVRLLFVVNGDQEVVGIITANDVLGEKPLKYVQHAGGTFDEVLVRHVMTPQECLQAIDFRDVTRSHVGDIVETLKHAGRQHALVVEVDEYSGTQSIRGIFSSTQIARQLGQEVVPTETARTFAEMGQALMTG